MADVKKKKNEYLNDKCTHRDTQLEKVYWKKTHNIFQENNKIFLSFVHNPQTWGSLEFYIVYFMLALCKACK